MKKILFTICLIITAGLYAQTTHTINTGGFYYNPSSLTIDVGDSVIWINDGGNHDVNGDISSLTSQPYNNPVTFDSPATNIVGAIIFGYKFTVSGTYNYDCSVYGHAQAGMVGTVIVNPPPTPPTSFNVTFSVDASYITVGSNGIYLGVPGVAQALAMSDPDGDGIWEGIDTLDGTAGGNYTFLNSPSSNSNWATMENLTGLPCADPAIWNFRILPIFSQDTILFHCFGTCDASCSVSPPTGIKDNINNVLIYPNPTSENITISIENFNGNIQTEFYDLIGNRLQATNETTISLQDYARGIYILKVAYGDRVEEVKVIKD
jgi:plastocyanin